MFSVVLNIPGIDDKYFTDPDVIDRVPGMLTYLSLLYAIVLTIAYFMVTLPPKSHDGNQEKEELGVWEGLKEFLKVFA